jgi:autotransporter-associated beta strand protein
MHLSCRLRSAKADCCIDKAIIRCVFVIQFVALVGAAPIFAESPQAGSVILPDLPPDYGWWNGCAPTAAAMLFAWWGQHGYGAFPANYAAPPATYPLTSTNPADYADARGVIAGWANKRSGMDWGLTYGSYLFHPPNSLADCLLTLDGSTNSSAVAHGLVTFGAWDDPSTPQIESRQFAATTCYTGIDWSYDRYVAEINAGRPVFLGWSSPSLGHATLGIGYNNTDGKHDVITLTTWRQGPQQWQWTNETNPYGLSVDSGVLMQPGGGETPRLSTYFSIARDFIGDMTIELGVGDPQNPQWKTTVRSPDNSQEHNLVLTDINAMAELSNFRTSPLNWYLKVTSTLAQYQGAIQDFQVRYGLDQRVFRMTGSPVSLVANTAVYANLQTTPFAISSVWLDSGRSSASWSDDAVWDQGVPQYLGDTATLGNSIGNAANATVTLDGDKTISGLTFANTAGGSYRIVPGSGGSLIFGNSAGPVQVVITSGNQTIAAPIVLNSDLLINTSSSATMTLSGQISGSGSLIKSGPGTVCITNAPSYDGTVIINAGTLQVSTGSPTVLNAITGAGTLVVDDVTDLKVDSINIGILTIGAGSSVVLEPVSGGSLTRTFTTNPVPEPAMLVMLCTISLVGAWVKTRRLR